MWETTQTFIFSDRTIILQFMKKPLMLAALLVSAISASAQRTDDPVIMTINGTPVLRSEFEYSYNKNNADGVLDKKSVKDYVPLFVDFKLKVLAAKDARLDTVQSIQRELQSYKEQMVMSTLVDSAFIEREARKTYDATAARFAGADMLTASHIFVRLAQNADSEVQKAAKAKIDSIYSVLQQGAKFEDVARQSSEDAASGMRGGSLGQFGKGMMIPDFEKVAYGLRVGEMSAPVLTAAGWHIIRLDDRHPFEPYEFHRESILRFLDQRGIRESSASALLDSLAQREGVDRSVVMNRYYEQLLKDSLDARYLAMEYEDGSLMYEISKTEVWDKAANDENGQEQFFRQNAKKYAWDAPRYRGVIVHAKEAAPLKQVKKIIKNKDFQDWPSAIVKAINTDSVMTVRVEHGIYKQGDNQNVDRLIFKSTKADKTLPGFPHVQGYGKKLKKPASHADVRGEVLTDYQSALEKAWVEGLRQRYRVVVDDAVVATVNAHE